MFLLYTYHKLLSIHSDKIYNSTAKKYIEQTKFFAKGVLACMSSKQG